MFINFKTKIMSQVVNLNGLSKSEHEYVMGFLNGPRGLYAVMADILNDGSRPEIFRWEVIRKLEESPRSQTAN